MVPLELSIGSLSNSDLAEAIEPLGPSNTAPALIQAKANTLLSGHTHVSDRKPSLAENSSQSRKYSQDLPRRIQAARWSI